MPCVFGFYGILWGGRDPLVRKGVYERIHRIIVPGDLVGIFVFRPDDFSLHGLALVSRSRLSPGFYDCFEI